MLAGGCRAPNLRLGACSGGRPAQPAGNIVLFEDGDGELVLQQCHARFSPLRFAVAVLVVHAFATQAWQAKAAGRFSGTLAYQSVPGKERVVSLLSPFSFISKSGEIWSVPTGAEVDGASIPRALWSVIGGPFTGKYREASVVHDYYCDVRNRAWEQTHWMFYEAMMANGVDPAQATIMYSAVHTFGPRWVTVIGEDGQPQEIVGTSPTTASKINARDRLLELAVAPDADPKEIDRLVNELVDEAADLQRAKLSGKAPEDCSVAVTSLGENRSPFVICKIARPARSLLAKRNLKIMLSDIEGVLDGSSQQLLPRIWAYQAHPTSENRLSLRLAAKQLSELIALTVLSIAQYDRTLASDKARSAVDQLPELRARKLLRTRSAVIGRLSERKLTPREVYSWQQVYTRLLGQLRTEFLKLQARL